jgi:hypothetical protein
VSYFQRLQADPAWLHIIRRNLLPSLQFAGADVRSDSVASGSSMGANSYADREF